MKLRDIIDRLIYGVSGHTAAEEAFIQGLFEQKLGEKGKQWYEDAIKVRK
jgi:hypothetical protein